MNSNVVAGSPYRGQSDRDGIRRCVSRALGACSSDTGTTEMRKVSDAIFTGAQAYLRRQYRTIALLAVVAAYRHRRGPGAD